MVYELYPLLLLLNTLVGIFSLSVRRSIILCLLLSVAFSIFVGLRGEFAGSDTIQYVSAYKNLPIDNFVYTDLAWAFVKNGITASEPGFVYFTAFMKNSGCPYWLYLSCISFISCVLIFSSFSSFSKYPVLCFSLYLFSITFISLHANVIRQCVAVGFYLLAISFYFKNKPFKFILFSVLAMSFHFSYLALFLLLLPAVFFNIRSGWYFLSLAVLILCVSTGLIGTVTNLVLPGFLAAKLLKYYSFGIGALFTFKLLSSLLFIFILFYVAKHSERNNSIDKLMIVYISSLMLQILFVGDLVASERFGLYKFVLESVIISHLIFVFKEKNIAKLSILFFSLIYGFVVYNLPSVTYMLGVSN